MLSCVIEVPTTALYVLRLSYVAQISADTVFALKIDEHIPFNEAGRLSFPAAWTDNGPTREDESGNQYAPDQILYTEAVVAEARDYSGRYELPYYFLLTAGSHRIQMTVQAGECRLVKAQLAPPEQPAAYAAPTGDTRTQTAPIVIEGETAVLKNDRSLTAQSDAGSAVVSPCDPILSKVNYIGGTNWQRPGTALTWKFETRVAGYYSLSFVYRQNMLLGGVSYRHLLIDGQTPFAEARRVKFTYDSAWKHEVYGDEEPYFVYLDAGEHTLTLAVTMGGASDIYAAVQSVTSRMGDLYVDITKIVGDTVDIYRSYELFNQIPGFNDTLDGIADDLEAAAAQLEVLQEQTSGTIVSNLRNAVRVVRLMRNNPYTAHRYKNDYYDAYTTLSALLGDMTDMPLSIDRIILTGAGEEQPTWKPSWWQRARFSLQRFIAAFSNDYATGDTADGEKAGLELWVNWGRDQARVLNNLIRDSFTRDSGIPVRVSVANATLIQALLSGNGPDCMLQLGRTEPVNYAMRGALKSLSDFEDIDEVLTRFNDGAAVPYRYNGKVYALPDTQGFYMMFLRTDILDKMEIAAPQTWDEFITTASLLQRSNLQAWVPVTMYPTLLLQNGLSLYREDETATLLTASEQIQVFSSYTNWYKKYQLPEAMDFYNRFRVGNVPMGIADYTLYTQLKATAPEIDGRWTVAPLPGVQRADGTIDNTSAGNVGTVGTGCCIIRTTESPDEAWELLKWWTRADTQARYSENLESAIGPLGRVAVSNLEAFASMDWDAAMLEQMLIQQKNIVELPEVPGGYYTTRSIDQAFWAVIEQGTTPMEAMSKWGEIADREIARKRAEYVDK